jgi:hypothetical protein
MNNPVAMRYDFDGYGYKYMDSGSGSDWQTRVEGEPLYTNPSEHDLGIAEAIGFDKGYKAGRQLGMKQERALWELSASTQEIENTQSNTQLHPAKTLTDEEIWKIYNITGLGNGMALRFARAILKKASEK